MTTSTVVAMIAMFEPGRGDLFFVDTSKVHFLVQVEEPLHNSQLTVTKHENPLKRAPKFVPGQVKLDANGEITEISVQGGLFASCKRVRHTGPDCAECHEAVMRSNGSAFICPTCGNILQFSS